LPCYDGNTESPVSLSRCLCEELRKLTYRGRKVFWVLSHFGVKAANSDSEAPGIFDFAVRTVYAVGSSCSFMPQAIATKFDRAYLYGE
jgi:hypothetical protein